MDTSNRNRTANTTVKPKALNKGSTSAKAKAANKATMSMKTAKRTPAANAATELARTRKAGRPKPRGATTKISQRLSNPFSTGGGGGHFEAHVQASFVALMLTGGHAPCLPCWPIVEVKLQGKVDGFDTDDLIVSVKDPDSGEIRRLVGQVKHALPITKANSVLADVIQAAWNDFNNPEVFDRSKDTLALITGPLSATDFQNVTWLLDQTRHTKSAEEFFRNVSMANFSPSRAFEKLEVVRHHLNAANGGTAVTDSQVYDFLRSYRLLGYDLGSEVGVVLSLLHSHISQVHQSFPEWAWSRVVDTVQTWNQDGGTITLERLPEDLARAFKPPPVVRIPPTLTVHEELPLPGYWPTPESADELAVATLLGSWDENKPGDIEVIEKLTSRAYSEWIKALRIGLLASGSPLKLKNGVWEVSERAGMWQVLGARIFDPLLEAYREQCTFVLTETDPAFDLSPDERFTASLHGKVLLHSGSIRTGMADGLALIGAKPESLTSCSVGKAETVAVLSIREILHDASSTLWGTLNDVVPALAEAAPNEFLKCVEAAIEKVPGPFDELFSQEGEGIEGRNYMVGLLWALEAIAWNEESLVRACAILAELASHDPGGRWTNRPSHSLTTILLPWLPQTRAPVEKRKTAVEVVCREQSEVGWKLVLSLLPNQHQTTSGSYRPRWRNPVADMNESQPTVAVYREQVGTYASLAVKLAGSEVRRLRELIDLVADLPTGAVETLLDVLSSEAILSLPEAARAELWERLTDVTAKHHKYAGAEWAMRPEQLAAVETVRDKLQPSDPILEHERLFSENDFDLYDERGNWEDQSQALQDRRNQAITQILADKGVDTVIAFAEAVESPRKVGHALGLVGNAALDQALLPGYLGAASRKVAQLADAYVWSRRRIQGWGWADAMDRTNWSIEQTGRFLSALPFAFETWVRADQWLADKRSEYWSRVPVNPFEASEGESRLELAVARLLECSRPRAAVECLYKMVHSNEAVPVELAVRALIEGVSSTESSLALHHHYIVDVIKSLQEGAQTNRDSLAEVEWAYLPLLGRREVRPVELERRIASDPDYYCQLVRAIYRSERERGMPKREPSEAERAVASNAWRLLHEWRRLPGTGSEGKLDAVAFDDWLQRVKKIAAESGHLSAALSQVGELLIHAPADESGLWIHRSVAHALNARDAGKMRDGFSVGIFNARGAHWVDPSGNEERKLADGYRAKADAVENAGYHRLAVTLREVADSYDREAERNTQEGIE